MTRWLAIVAAVAAAACSRHQVNTGTTTTSSSSGDVALNGSGGAWIDTIGGAWMDGSGGMSRGRRGMAMGLQPADVRMMSNSNIVAHLATGDSLEVALSQIGADRAQSGAVREFARRMVLEHTGHLQMGKQMAMQGGLAPTPAPSDTADVMMATQLMYRLSGAPANNDYDRQLMRVEVMMHQHMLHELNLVRPQASGTALQLVDQTIPIVQQHLTDARALWRQVGGGRDARADMNP
jgi:putative membrane protein